MSRNLLLAGLASAATVVVVATGVVAAPRLTEAPPGPRSTGPVEITAAQAPAVPPLAAVQAAAVLRAWDDRRAAAWAHGDPAGLAALYTPGSGAGRRDRAMLRAWAARGLVVRGLTTQLLAVREVQRTASTWTLRVTDRLTGGTAVGPGIRTALPHDSATTRTVRLELVDGLWRVSAVTPVTA